MGKGHPLVTLVQGIDLAIVLIEMQPSLDTILALSNTEVLIDSLMFIRDEEPSRFID
jgi:hypothetical protein